MWITGNTRRCASFPRRSRIQSTFVAAAQPRISPGQRAVARAADVRRGQQELTQKMLADRSGVSLRQVADFLAGKSWPLASNRVKLATALAWPRNELDRLAAEYDDARLDMRATIEAEVMDSNLSNEAKLLLVELLLERRLRQRAESLRGDAAAAEG